MNACDNLTMGLTIDMILVIGGNNGGPKTIQVKPVFVQQTMPPVFPNLQNY